MPTLSACTDPRNALDVVRRRELAFGEGPKLGEPGSSFFGQKTTL